jgi:hypothetical protein
MFLIKMLFTANANKINLKCQAKQCDMMKMTLGANAVWLKVAAHRQSDQFILSLHYKTVYRRNFCRGVIS